MLTSAQFLRLARVRFANGQIIEEHGLPDLFGLMMPRCKHDPKHPQFRRHTDCHDDRRGQTPYLAELLTQMSAIRSGGASTTSTTIPS